MPHKWNGSTGEIEYVPDPTDDAITDILDYLDKINEGYIPERFPHEAAALCESEHFALRRKLTTRNIWGLVDMAWTSDLLDMINAVTGLTMTWTTTLEVYAGAGLLSKALAVHGVGTVICTTVQHGASDAILYDKIEIAPAINAVLKYRDTADILIASWIPRNDANCVAVGELWGTKKPMAIIRSTIGSAREDITASREFWDHFNPITTVALPSWVSFEDTLSVGYWNN